jgi:hypothetical protein
VIEKISGALSHVFIADFLVNQALVEEPGERSQVTFMAGDNEILAYEDIKLAGRGDAVSLVENGKMEDYKEIRIEIVYLGTLDFGEDVVKRKSVKVKIVREVLDLPLGRLLDVIPGKPAVAAG